MVYQVGYRHIFIKDCFVRINRDAKAPPESPLFCKKIRFGHQQGDWSLQDNFPSEFCSINSAILDLDFLCYGFLQQDQRILSPRLLQIFGEWLLA
jgi:hypothetical protein